MKLLQAVSFIYHLPYLLVQVACWLFHACIAAFETERWAVVNFKIGQRDEVVHGLARGMRGPMLFVRVLWSDGTLRDVVYLRDAVRVQFDVGFEPSDSEPDRCLHCGFDEREHVRAVPRGKR